MAEPSLLISQPKTEPSCSASVSISSPVLKFQILRAPSFKAVTTRELSGLITQSWTGSEGVAGKCIDNVRMWAG